MLERTPTIGLDYETRDFDGFKHLMIQELKRRIPEYADFSENDLGMILIELFALGQDIQSYYIDKVANESRLSTATERQNVVELCANLGYELSNATPSIFEQVFEVEESDTPTYIPKGFAINTYDNGFDEVLRFETEEELIIPPNCIGNELDEEGNYLYSVRVVQGKTIEEELLGSSNGLPNQEFPLWESPVIASQVEVYVNEGGGYVPWTYVPSFLQSESTDQHFSLKIDGSSSAKVVFGNGTLGAIPTEFDGGIIAKYRVGGGSKGNVIPNSITEMVSPLANIKATYNPKVAQVEGVDVESLEDAKANATRRLRTLERAVTLQDHKDIAFRLPFVMLSDAKELEDGRTVEIFLVSKSGEVLSEEEKEQAQNLYSTSRMLGVIPVVKDANFVEVDLTVTVEKTKRDMTDYVELVNSLAKDYFALGNFNFQKRFIQSAFLKQLMLFLPNAEDISVSLTHPHPTLAEGDIITLGTLEVEVI